MRKRVRPLLLVLLWVWAVCIFMILDLFLNIPEFDAVRPRASLYRGMRIAAHRMVGERSPDHDILASDANRRGRATTISIQGVVFTPDQRPAPGARVAARHWRTGVVVRGLADRNGRFWLAVEHGGVCEISAAATGYGAALGRTVAPGHIELALTEEVRITGRAVDSSGKGVPAVRLRLRSAYSFGFGEGRLSFEEGVVEELLRLRTTSGPDGAFVIGGIPSERRVLALEIAGGPVRVGDAVPVVLHAGDVQLEVPVVRAEHVTVTGVVCDRASRLPLAEAEIEFPGGVVQTDADGAFCKDSVPQGLVPIEVRVPGRRRYATCVMIGQPPASLDLRVPRSTTAGPDGHR